MSSFRVLTALAVAGALTVATGAAVQAQPQGGAGATQQQSLPAILHLQPNQMTAFQSFQAASQPTADEINRLRGAAPQALAGLPTPQRLDRIAAGLSVREQIFRRSADATRAFYAQLSPDQQRTFDRVTAPPRNQGGRQ